MTAQEILFQKFKTSSQEPVRLRLALDGFFASDTPQPIREQYEIYLRRRVRPTLEALIAAEDMARLEALEAQGWLDAALTEDGLKFAAKEKKTEPFVWLLRKKAEKYGFSDREFLL